MMEQILAKLLRNLLEDGAMRVEYETDEFKFVAYKVGEVYRVDMKRNKK